MIDPSGLMWLTKDNKTYIWVENDVYRNNQDKFKDYYEANGAIIQYHGSSDCNSCDGLKRGDWIELRANGLVHPVEDPTRTSNVYEPDDVGEAMIASTMAAQQWVAFRNQLPDFKPAYVNVEVDVPSQFGKSGPAFSGTLDRNGNVFFGVGAWGGSPGASGSIGWLLPNERAENIESFLAGDSAGVTYISPYWVGGGVQRSSGRYSPQISVGTPGTTGSYTRSKKVKNVGRLW